MRSAESYSFKQALYNASLYTDQFPAQPLVPICLKTREAYGAGSTKECKGLQRGIKL